MKILKFLSVFSTLICCYFLFLGPLSSVPPYKHTNKFFTENLEQLEKDIEIKELAHSLPPEIEKKILWKTPYTKSKLSIVYLHGFSASKKEISPVVENLCLQINANCFFSRLSGHGLDETSFGKATYQDWLDDASEAIEIGKKIGEKVIVIGTSTGAPLALWASYQDKNILSCILISPNFRPQNPLSILARGPIGKILPGIILGPTVQWTPKNSLQEKYWNWKYPSSSLHELMELLKVTNEIDLKQFHKPVLMLYSSEDPIVSSPIAEKYFSLLPDSTKQKILSPWPKSHIFAGDILNHEGTVWTLEKINQFLLKQKIFN